MHVQDSVLSRLTRQWLRALLTGLPCLMSPMALALETPETKLLWQACAPVGYQCATLNVPLTYTDPSSGTVALALKRLPATNARERIGTLFIEPGGPGGSGVQALPEFVAGVSADVRQRFDVVGFDPRGVGQSVLLLDGEPEIAHQACRDDIALYFAHDLTQTDTPNPSLDEAARDYATRCAHDPLLAHMGTLNVVRDLDQLRQATGDAALTYLGVSYGTEVGILYAHTYPERVRAMIIDGVVNPAIPGERILIDQAAAWNGALDAFFQWCDSREDCPLKPDARSAFLQVLERARQQPAAASVHEKPFGLSAGWITLGAVMSVYDPAGFPGLAQQLHNALQGDWSGFQQGLSAFAESGAAASAVWVTCLDQPLPTGSGFDALLAEAVRRAPLTGALAANINRPCAHLPVPASPVPPDYRAAGSPTIMVWGTTGDPATPYVNSVQVVKQLENAALYTLESARHTAMGANECVIRLQSDYLLHARLPEGKRVC